MSIRTELSIPARQLPHFFFAGCRRATPIALIQAVVDGMCERGWGRVVNITSSSVKSPIATLPLSNGARGGLTGFVAGVAREVAPHGPPSTTCCRGRSPPIDCSMRSGRGRPSAVSRSSRRWPSARPRFLRGGLASLRNSARRVRSCAPRLPGTSRGRTS